MKQRSHDHFRMWMMGAAIGVPTALGLFGTEPLAFGEGKLSVVLFQKKSITKPAAAVVAEPPRLLPVPEVNSSQIQTVSDSQELAANGRGEKTEVMKQLELLYEKDGREMPELQTMQPVANGQTSPEVPGTTRPGVPAQQSAPANTGLPQPRMQAPYTKNGTTNQVMPNGKQSGAMSPSVAPVAPPSKNPVTGFFKKLIPGGKDTKTTAAPPTYHPSVAPLPPNARPQNRLPEYAPVQVRTETVPAPSAYSLTPVNQGMATPASGPALNFQPELLPGRASPTLTGTSPRRDASDVPPSPLAESPAFAPNLPALSSGSASLPPLLSQTGSTSTELPPLVIELPESKPTKALTGTDADNPFTEMSEAEADGTTSADPFTGLTFDEEDSQKSNDNKNADSKGATATSEKGMSSGTAATEDPFAEELRKLGILPPLGAESVGEQSTTKLVPPSQEPTSADVPSLIPPSLDGIEDAATREKIAKIRERGGMKGLKGFCPVTLHDERELVDAKSDHHATHRGQKFHFASAEAMSKFVEDPSRYAPAAYGADVVALTRDKDVVEGSLDFAAWFKGRLYLFGSQEAHDTFVTSPVQFATPAGIE